MPKLKVGERVRVSDKNSCLYNMQGTIIACKIYKKYLVAFDSFFTKLVVGYDSRVKLVLPSNQLEPLGEEKEVNSTTNMARSYLATASIDWEE